MSACGQEGEPLPGPKSGLLFNTRKWIVQGDTCADRGKGAFEKAAPVENIKVRELRRTALPCSSKSQGLSGTVSFQVVCGQSSCATHIWSDSGSFLGTHASLSQDRFQHKGFWEIGRTYYGLSSPRSFGPLPNSSSWFCWWLISFVFFIGTSCCEASYISA